MKRIFAVALVLCLLCASALADSRDYARGVTDTMIVDTLKGSGFTIESFFSSDDDGYCLVLSSYSLYKATGNNVSSNIEFLETICMTMRDIFTAYADGVKHDEKYTLLVTGDSGKTYVKMSLAATLTVGSRYEDTFFYTPQGKDTITYTK